MRARAYITHTVRAAAVPSILATVAPCRTTLLLGEAPRTRRIPPTPSFASLRAPSAVRGGACACVKHTAGAAVVPRRLLPTPLRATSAFAEAWRRVWIYNLQYTVGAAVVLARRSARRCSSIRGGARAQEHHTGLHPRRPARRCFSGVAWRCVRLQDTHCRCRRRVKQCDGGAQQCARDCAQPHDDG